MGSPEPVRAFVTTSVAFERLPVKERSRDQRQTPRRGDAVERIVQTSCSRKQEKVRLMSCSSSDRIAAALIADHGGASRRRIRSNSPGEGMLGKPIFGTSDAMTCQKAR